MHRIFVLKKVVQKVKTHLMLINFFFRKLCRLRDSCKKYGIARDVKKICSDLIQYSATWISMPGN